MANFMKVNTQKNLKEEIVDINGKKFIGRDERDRKSTRLNSSHVT